MGKLTARDMATSADELLAFRRRFQDLFKRREQRDWSLLYLCGQLSNLERKTIEALVLDLLGPDANAIRTAQHFIGQGKWPTAPFLDRVQDLVADWLGEPDGGVIMDGSGFPKQGSYSVAVANQYCGHLGKTANCQEGALALYASRCGYAFLDKRLYVPKIWFTADYQDRWRAGGIPDALTFRTEPELGLEMLTQLVERAGVPFRWVTCDERYGEIPAFLDGIVALGKWYFAEVAADTRAWLRAPQVEPPGQGLGGAPRIHPRVKRTAPRPYEMRELVRQVPRAQWQWRKIKEGNKGLLVAEFACWRVTPIRDGWPGQRCWVIFRRTLGVKPEVKFFMSNAPSTCSLQEFVRVSGLRWPIETGLKEAKGGVGMDHYETRTWLGWHHHMTQSILVHLFLVRLQLVVQKKSRVDHRPSSPAHCTGHQRRAPAFARRSGRAELPPAPKSCCLSFTSQAHTFTAGQALV